MQAPNPGYSPSLSVKTPTRFRPGRALLAITLLSVLLIKELVFVHVFGLVTFLRPELARTPGAVRLDLGYWNKFRYRLILLARYLCKRQFLWQRAFRRVHDAMLARLERSGANGQHPTLPIATLLPGELDGEEFWRRYVKTCTPVVIKGGARHTIACKQWTPEWFAEHFGDFRVNIIDQRTNQHMVGDFADVVASSGTERKLYIHNSANIFSYNPELFDQIECLSMREHMGGRRTLFAGAQLFLGVHPSTGTEFHSASNFNLFYQVYGKKKWTFVNPDHSWLMYPMLNRFFLFCASFIRMSHSREYLDKYAPLYRFCPRYEVVLEPGDILFNPPWQWHAIDNVTERSIGVATRWFPTGTRRTNTFFDFCQLLSTAIWRLRFHGLVNNPNEPVIVDESTRGLVKSHDDYIDFGRVGSLQRYDFHTWPEDQQFTRKDP
jgi:hypothetical protein